MKTIKLFSVLGLVLFTGIAQAQLTVNISIGTPPQWGPIGYTDVRYYYLPAVEAYYDVQTTTFIYYSDGVWVRRYNLPSRYRSYDLYGGYKVVMSDYRGETPYVHFADQKTKYNRSYRGIPQRTIGEKPGQGNSKSHKQHGHQGGRGKKF
jgi:hypothetical protein